MSLKISVVIPVYNASKTIVSTINSILNQTYKVSEIILVDDGSSDDTSSIIENVFEEYLKSNFIVLIKKKNEGPSIARNLGVEIAKNEWIAFLDSDDQWLHNKIEKQTIFIERNQNVKICGTASNVLNFKKKAPFFFVTYKELLYRNFFCTSSILISKTIFTNSKKFNSAQKYSEDYGLWLEILSFGCDGAVLNESLVHYNVSEGERLSSNSFLMMKGEIANYKKQFNVKKISTVFLFFLILLSIVKFFKRALF